MLYLAKHALVYHADVPWHAMFTMLLYHGMLYLAKHAIVYHAAVPWHAIFSQACFSLPCCYTMVCYI